MWPYRVFWLLCNTKKKGAYEVEESSIQQVQRIANEYDMELHGESQEREKEAFVLARVW